MKLIRRLRNNVTKAESRELVEEWNEEENFCDVINFAKFSITITF